MLNQVLLLFFQPGMTDAGSSIPQPPQTAHELLLINGEGGDQGEMLTTSREEKVCSLNGVLNLDLFSLVADFFMN